MAIAFNCSCGEPLELPESYSGGQAYCLRCQRSVEIPASVLAAAGQSAAPVSPPVSEEIETVNLPASAVDPRNDNPLLGGTTPLAAAALPTAPDGSRTLASAGPARGDGYGSGLHDQAPQYELVAEPDGAEHWKVTCFCGKRLLTPTQSETAYGRCPKCKRRIRLPGYDALLKTLDIGAAVVTPGAGTTPAPPGAKTLSGRAKTGTFTKADLDKALELVLAQDDIVTEVALLRAEPPRTNNAALTAAERLRPQRSEIVADRTGSGSGHVAAWPLAGVVRRALAGFIDVTFAISVTALIVFLSLKGLLAPFFRGWDAVLLVLLCAGFFNDGLIHLLFGGSLGKKLVVIVVRNFAGTNMEPSRTLARAVFKWLFIPGWIIGAVDPAQRTLHDIICGTLVLKGRLRRGPPATPGVRVRS